MFFISAIKRAAAVTLVALSFSAVSAPAYANSNISGSISIGIQGSTPEEKQAIANGLFLYALFQGLQGDEAALRQLGNGNTAGFLQNGTGNFGIIEQHGDDHTGTLNQQGNGNAFGLFQFGQGTEGHVTQQGNGEGGLLFQFGF